MDIIKRKSLFLFLKIRSLQNKIIMINKTCTHTKKIDRDRIGQTKTHKFRLRILHTEKKNNFLVLHEYASENDSLSNESSNGHERTYESK